MVNFVSDTSTPPRRGGDGAPPSTGTRRDSDPMEGSAPSPPGGRGGLIPAAIALLLCLSTATVAPSGADTPAAQPTVPAPVTITTAVEPQRVKVGTPFRYTMRVEASGDIELMVPLLGDRLGEFAITDFGEVPHEKSAGKAVVERWYTMVTYEAGDQIIPGPPIQYRVPGQELARVDSPETLIIVDSLLPKGEDALAKASIRDIKGPVALPPNYGPLWWAVAALAVLAIIGYVLYVLLNRPRGAAAPQARPAHELALESLARLRNARLLEEGRYEDYYVRLSGIVRAYLEGRFHLRAPEMTTEEFLQAAQKNRQLPVEHRAALSQFLGEADQVKFARYVPSEDDADRAFRAAKHFVETTAIRAEGDRAAA